MHGILPECFSKLFGKFPDMCSHSKVREGPAPKKGYIGRSVPKPTRGILMVLVVLVVLVVLEVPGPEIQILQEISSPELAGYRR